MTRPSDSPLGSYRHLSLVRHALGVKVALDLDDHPTAYAELVALLDAVTDVQGALGLDTTPAAVAGRATYTPADVKRAHCEDATRVQHLTTAKVQGIALHERARGHRAGQRDLAASLGYPSAAALARALRDRETTP